MNAKVSQINQFGAGSLQEEAVKFCRVNYENKENILLFKLWSFISEMDGEMQSLQ